MSKLQQRFSCLGEALLYKMSCCDKKILFYL